MNNRNNRVPALAKKDLEKAFQQPKTLTQKPWRITGTVLDLPVGLINLGERYEFEEKDQQRMLFILEVVEHDAQDDQPGLLLSWRLWDTEVVWNSFVPETKKAKGTNEEFCLFLLGGDFFERVMSPIFRKVNSPEDVYELCREQTEERSLEILHEILV